MIWSLRRVAQDPGYLVCALAGALLLTLALTVDFPKAAFGFQSDGATYYSLGHSLAEDWDFTFERKDLERVWHEFPSGPEGIFLKKGKRVDVDLHGHMPFIELRTLPDDRFDRLYYGKAYIYPLAAAPFVMLFGTNGFLVLHALLLTTCLVAGYAWLSACSPPGPAIVYAVAFLFASAAPVYFVWLTPEVFNLSVCWIGLFLWSYKLVAPATVTTDWGRFLRSPASDIVAACVIGVAAFSKPTNVMVMAPMLLHAAWRRQWRRGLLAGSACAAVVAGLFLLNVAITGEYNYQGGDRNTFYGSTGFPFQRQGATFDNTGISRATNAVPTDVLFNRDALLRVFPRNLVYFTFGRHTGLAPYFFPGILSVVLLLLAWRRSSPDRWAVLLGVIGGSVALLLYMPFTYSGGGGPIGNRYFLGFYPLFLFLTPPLRSVAPGLIAMAVGGLFTAQLVINPFYVSFHPAEHAKTGLYRLLPVELSLLNDLPMNVSPSKVKQPLGGDPPVLAYFLDDNAFRREGEWFWVRGQSRAELVLRAPARVRPDGELEGRRIRSLRLELRTGDVASRVDVRSGGVHRRLDLGPGAMTAFDVTPEPAFPYRAVPGEPTNYLYQLSVSSSTGFVPLFSSPGSRDSRYLGVMVHVVAMYE